MLETSAFQSLYGGQFTLSTPLINQIFTFYFNLKLPAMTLSITVVWREFVSSVGRLRKSRSRGILKYWSLPTGSPLAGKGTRPGHCCLYMYYSCFLPILLQNILRGHYYIPWVLLKMMK